MKNIIAQFFNQTLDYQYAVFGSGNINDTYLLDIDDKKYILQRINDAVFSNPIGVQQNILHLETHLENQSDYALEILKTLRTNDGESCYFDSNTNNYWRVFHYIDNNIAFDVVPNIDIAEKAAAAFGHYFRHLSDFDATLLHLSIPDFHNASFRWQQYQDALLQNKANRKEIIEKEITFITDNQSIINEYESVIATLPLRTIHYDTKINNVLFDKNTLFAKAVIDLDTTMPGYVTSDFGDLVRTATPNLNEDANPENVVLDIHLFEAITKGFLSETKSILTDSEKNALIYGGKLLIYIQAIRFLTDYLNGDTYYKIKYETHNFVRAQNQMALLQSLLSQEYEMEKIVKLELGK